MIVNAMSLSQLQMMRHFLQEMEAQGVKTLSDARRIVTNAEQKAHEERVYSRKRKPMIKSHAPCPHCGKPLVMISTDEGMVTQCKSCRWSALVEG